MSSFFKFSCKNKIKMSSKSLFFLPIFLLLGHEARTIGITGAPVTCTIKEFSEVQDAIRSCKHIVIDNLFVPAGVTLKLNLTEGTKVVLRGNTTFGFKNWFGPLVTINGTGIVMEGEKGAVIDGLGPQYWDGLGGWGTPKPQFFTIQAFHSIFRNIVVHNSPQDVVQATNAINVTFDNWLIDDRDGDELILVEGKNVTKGHNSDGFDVWNSTDILIQNSVVYNQDDCVAVRCGANVLTRNLFCHGGHGLSISVGFSKDNVALNTLTNVTFENCVMRTGGNGIHIKTHNDGTQGSISNVIYKNIDISAIENFGIEIQQNYPKGEVKGNVPITGLKMINVTGDVKSKATPVFILCADGACRDFEFNNVSFTGGKKDNCNFKPQGYSC